MRREAFVEDTEPEASDLAAGQAPLGCILVFSPNKPIADRLFQLLDQNEIKALVAMSHAELVGQLRHSGDIEGVVTATRFVADVSNISRRPIINYEVFVRDDGGTATGSLGPVYFEPDRFLARVASLVSRQSGRLGY